MTGTRIVLAMVACLALLAQGCCGHRKWVCNSACGPSISCFSKVCSKPVYRVMDPCDCD